MLFPGACVENVNAVAAMFSAAFPGCVRPEILAPHPVQKSAIGSCGFAQLGQNPLPTLRRTPQLTHA
jgi:hypothetical protein